ncbi:hypothetical protein BD311DRAFT_775946 [Dichomitus squalens]|uniref:Uncharacterized protein n=1 Tax=Dichomitus squalens TaxID=114155 RepID=A0A4Q9MXZ5_9APHY|nr:hypothetical protein BD311DRAFT_775946 [Dichomitus squalens]
MGTADVRAGCVLARPSEDPRPARPERANPHSPLQGYPATRPPRSGRPEACLPAAAAASDAHAGGGGRTQPIARHISVTALGPRAARSVGDLATQNPVLSARCSGAICTDATDAKPRPPTRAACLWV